MTSDEAAALGDVDGGAVGAIAGGEAWQLGTRVRLMPMCGV